LQPHAAKDVLQSIATFIAHRWSLIKKNRTGNLSLVPLPTPLTRWNASRVNADPILANAEFGLDQFA
jgi:hypothetical protein